MKTRSESPLEDTAEGRVPSAVERLLILESTTGVGAVHRGLTGDLVNYQRLTRRVSREGLVGMRPQVWFQAHPAAAKKRAG